MDRRHFPSDILESSIFDILSLVKPTEGDREKRARIINEFRAVVGSVESLRGATVEPFGSFVSNLYTRWGDLDISVELPSGSLISSVGKQRKQGLLRDIMRALRRNGHPNLKLIPNARVPLLIYQSSYQSISCDISICNPLGQVKSQFMLWITEIDDRFRNMVLLIKEWAKAKDINDSKTGTLNSYSLCLLVIFHFQTCNPSILPPLKDIYRGNIADDLTGAKRIVERRIKDQCDANIARFKHQRFCQANQSSLSKLFVSFFEKFSRIDFLSAQYAFCTYTGQFESITSKEKWMKKTHKILIEDPFEQPDNAARAVSMNGLARISQAFEETHRMLSSATVRSDRNRLMAGLVRPHISSRIGAGNPRGNIDAHTRVSHPMPLPDPVMRPIQDRFTQVMRMESRPSSSNVSGQRYGMESRPSSSNVSRQRYGTVQRQGQQQWRQKNF